MPDTIYLNLASNRLLKNGRKKYSVSWKILVLAMWYQGLQLTCIWVNIADIGVTSTGVMRCICFHAHVYPTLQTFWFDLTRRQPRVCQNETKNNKLRRAQVLGVFGVSWQN